MEKVENKIQVHTAVATAGISQYTSVDLTAEVSGSLSEWMRHESIAKIHSTETKVHSVQDGKKWFLVCTITIVYELTDS